MVDPSNPAQVLKKDINPLIILYLWDTWLLYTKKLGSHKQRRRFSSSYNCLLQMKMRLLIDLKIFLVSGCGWVWEVSLQVRVVLQGSVQAMQKEKTLPHMSLKTRSKSWRQKVNINWISLLEVSLSQMKNVVLLVTPINKKHYCQFWIVRNFVLSYNLLI